MRFVLPFAAVALLACSSTIVSEGAGSGAGSGGASSSSSGEAGSSSADVSTSNVSATVGSASSTVATSSSSGGQGGGACDGTVTLVVDNVAQPDLHGSCDGQFGAVEGNAAAFRFAGGPVGAPHGIEIYGCVDSAPSVGVVLTANDADGVGDYTDGSVRYTDATGTAWTMPISLEIKIQQFDAHAEGAYSANVAMGGNAAHQISGTFGVCHIMDELLP